VNTTVLWVCVYNGVFMGPRGHASQKWQNGYKFLSCYTCTLVIRQHVLFY